MGGGCTRAERVSARSVRLNVLWGRNSHQERLHSGLFCTSKTRMCPMTLPQSSLSDPWVHNKG